MNAEPPPPVCKEPGGTPTLPRQPNPHRSDPMAGKPPLPDAALLERAFGACLDCVAILTREGRVLRMNDAGRREWAIDEPEIRRDAPWPEFWVGADRGAAESAVATALANKVGRFTGARVAAGGAVSFWEAILTPIPNAAGETESILAVARDVTERHQTEKSLRERATQLKAIFEGEPQCVKVVGLDGRLLEMNRAGLAMLEVDSLTEIKQRSLLDFVVPQHREAFRGLYQRVLRGESGTIRFEIAGTRGTHRWLETHATPLRDDAGAVRAMLGITRDITGQRELEGYSFHAQRLEGIGMLAAGIAHDLNNVLSPILMGVPMLANQTSDPGALQLLAMIGKSAERGANLVRQILAFSRQSSGEIQQMDLKHLLRDLSNVIHETFPKSIRFAEVIAPDLWMVEGSPIQIHQVLLNLCVNARDAMLEGGTLTVSAENCMLDETSARAIADGEPGAFVLFKVTDTGTGIPPEVLPRIWEPFYTTKDANKGTGLGLATVRGIVEHHRGFVAIDTALGCGTTFRVWLPAKETPRPATIPPFPPGFARGNGELILIVDDEETIRRTAAAALAQHGYRTLTAADGAEAVLSFARNSHAISLVITDLNMPNLDGWALVRSIRQVKPTTKILVISGSTGERPSSVGAAGSDDAFLNKPFVIGGLLREVQKLLANGTPPQ